MTGISPAPRFRSVCEAVLASGSRVRFVATGASMAPTIADGEPVLVRPCAGDGVVPGDVLLYRAGERLFAHRVQSVVAPADGQGGAIVVKGDAWGQEEETIALGDVVGLVEAVIRKDVLMDLPRRAPNPARVLLARLRRVVKAMRVASF